MPERKGRGRTKRGGAAPGGAKGGSRAAAAAPARKRRKQAGQDGLIAVDIGNSETVVGFFRGADLDGFWRLTSARQTADEVVLRLEALLRSRRASAGSGGSDSRPAAAFCSVVPHLTLPWAEALERWTGRPAFEVSSETARSLSIRYHDRTAVGADRIANAIAVRALYGTPAIVVDLGTATTFDCVSRNGAYLGGVIAPGVGTSAEELFRRASRLPRVELRRPLKALGRTTEESVRAGVLWGTAGQVDALVRRLALEMKGTPHVIATGGYARAIAPECETINRVDEGLTLKGMRLLWEESAS
jgi:type III pantothenate kinase